MSALSRRGALGGLAVLCAPIPLPAKADTGHAGLVALVEEFEAAHARVESLWADDLSCMSDPAWKPAVSECGRLRAAIALHPVGSMADVMLKVRAYAVSNYADDADDLAVEITGNRGHAYDSDVATAVVVGLLKLREAGLCA